MMRRLSITLVIFGCSMVVGCSQAAPGADTRTQDFTDEILLLGICVSVAFGTLLAIAFGLVSSALFRTGRFARVFISYYHENVNVAKAIAGSLDRSRCIETFLIPFQSADFDETITQIRKGIQNSSLLIVLPGPDRSFVDAEVLAASALNKPVLFVRTERSTLPDTALSGYPVLSWHRLEGGGLSSLSEFALLACGHWSCVFRECTGLIRLALLYTVVVGVSLIPLRVIWDLILFVLQWFVESRTVVRLMFGPAYVGVGLIFVCAMVFFCQQIQTRRRILRVARQCFLNDQRDSLGFNSAIRKYFQRFQSDGQYESIVSALDDSNLARRSE